MKRFISKNIEGSACSRREFMKDVAKGVGFVALGSFTVSYLSSCSDDSNPSVPVSNTDAQITIDITLPENNSLSNVGGSIVIPGNNLDSTGMLIFRKSESEIVALSRTCTHKGCTLPNFLSGSVRCPCHGSRFDTSGNVLNGPANEKLKSYNAVLEGNIITISV